MKMKTLFAVFIMAISFALITSCKTNPRNALVRRWQISDVSGPGITPDIKARMIGSQNGISFSEDGKYVNYEEGKNDETGVYTLSPDAKTVTLNGGNGQMEAIAIQELNKDKLVGTVNGFTTTFIPYNK